MTDRRNFLRSMIGGLAATAAVRTWPFRVYSFPNEIITGHQISVAFVNSKNGQVSSPSPGEIYWPRGEALELESVREQMPCLINGVLYVRNDHPAWVGLERSRFLYYVADSTTTRR